MKTTILATLLAVGGTAAAQSYTMTSSTPTYTATATPSYKLYGTSPQYDRVEGEYTASPTGPTTFTGISLSNGVLTIISGSAADGASVYPSGTNVIATRGSYQATYVASSVRKIVFHGNGGNDTFVNRTDIKCEAYGGDGNDSLTGGSDEDFLVGGLGDDTLWGGDDDDVLWGSGGHDALHGGRGDDHLKGHGGNDFMTGDGDDDALYGGSGDDEMNGGDDVDTLVTIGGGYDTVVGGAGTDYFWVDSTDYVVSPSTIETNEAYINKVSSYYRYSYNGGATSTAVAKDLTSYDLDDPTPDFASDAKVNYAAHPLFSQLGPTQVDVFQRTSDDCYILGPLSAVAMQTPDSIRKLVVDLDDGTYVVRQYRTDFGLPEYVRVDADLYVDGNGVLRYAGLGRDGSIWVPIVEKAFAFFRNKMGSYDSIDGGNSGTGGKLIFRATNETHTIPELYDEHDIVAWVAAGRPSNHVKTYIDSTVPQLLNWIAERLDEGRPVYTGYIAGTHNATTITTDNWRRGAHIIMIERVNFDANGNPTGLVIRDQLDGANVTFTDRARIYHIFGRAHTYDMP